MEYFDLYLIHFPISLKYIDPSVRYPPEWKFNERMEPDMTVTFEQTWHAMESLVDDKLVKNIGSCNVGCDKIQDVWSYARIKPAVL